MAVRGDARRQRSATVAKMIGHRSPERCQQARREGLKGWGQSTLSRLSGGVTFPAQWLSSSVIVPGLWLDHVHECL